MIRSSVARRAVAACVGAIAFLTGHATSATAQPNPYRLERLAPDVYVAVRDMTSGGFSDSNVLIIINDRDVVVVDANLYPSSAQQMIAEIKRLTPKPVRYVINTHWHGDHHFGNQAYLDAFPGVAFIQHPATRASILEEGVPSLERAVRSEYPALIQAHRTALQTGKLPSGASLSDQQREQMTKEIALYEFYIKELQGLRQIPGTLMVSDSLVLNSGTRSIVVKHLGLGNTAGDLVVYLPEERIVATGDLVVHPVPFAFGAYLREWPATLRRLRSLDATTIVPGHGALQHDWTYVDRLIQLVDATWSQVERAVARGADLDGVRAAVNVDSIVGTFVVRDATRRQRAFAAMFVNPGVEAAFKQLRPDTTRKP